MIADAVLALLAPLLAGSLLVVAPDGPYPTIAAALLAAAPGDTIEVRGGVHPGPLVVDRAVTLVGVDAPVIDGGGRGTVITLTAPGTVLRGFVIRGSGNDLNAEDTGVLVRAADVTVAANRLEDVLTGIALEEAPRGILRGNQIQGKLTLAAPDRGDGLKLWSSPDVLVEGNQIAYTRDCVIWYSSGPRLIGNTIEHGRYGLHFMYDDGAVIEGNVLRSNSVGAYLMYSRRVTLRDNLLAGSRGPSGFGLGLKDVDDLRLERNWLVDNRVGAWIDNSPTSLNATSRFEDNVIAFNDIGLTLQPAVQRNTFVGNTFRENQQQVSLQGGGTLRGNQWAEGGRGNYWSDYVGLDIDGDGVGDLPYRAEALAADLMDRQPVLRFFQFGLAGAAVEFAGRAFPALRPTPKLTDEAPLLAPPAPPAPPGQAPVDARPALGLGLGLLALASGILGLTRGHGRPAGARAVARPAGPALVVAGLTKRFGRRLVVDTIGFEVAPGEVVALWGPNGAGKTTALKCILGLLPCQGRVLVAGHDALRQGPRARRALGYVPQEVALYDDLSVTEAVSLYGRLKRVPTAAATPLLAALGLVEHAGQPVGTLSGGLRQRLALAIALMGDPPLLILDEPLSNLDAASRDLVIRFLIDRRRQGTAMLITSHRVDEIEQLADRVLVLEQGRLATVCAPHELAERLSLRVTLKVRVGQEHRLRAAAVLQAAGLTASPNGTAVRVAVPPTAKGLPLRLLERAGILVTDFTIEDSAVEADEGNEP